MYVGFYAARLATINVSNIQLTVTSAATDSPKIEPPATPVTPSLNILSLSKTSDPAYQMIVRSNVNGTVTLKQGSTIIAQDIEEISGKRLSIPTRLLDQGDTNFSITFLPDDTQYLTSYEKIISNFTVTLKVITKMMISTYPPPDQAPEMEQSISHLISILRLISLNKVSILLCLRVVMCGNHHLRLKSTMMAKPPPKSI